jgi:type II secretory pathway pseudopilin PulG
MNKRVYGAFTLVEMLIVMGILIILMVVGIAAGSFALNRASDVAHRNAADQLYEGLQAYYVDNRAYPKIDSCEGTCTPALLMDQEDKLGKYMDLGAFNGGSGATFTYLVGGSNDDQAVLVCVSMRGTYEQNNDAERTDGAFYCAGNGFQTDVSDGDGNNVNIDVNLVEFGDTNWTQFDQEFTSSSDWDDNEWVTLGE